MLTEIPTSRPETPLLDTVNSPADLKKLARSQLKELAHELRLFLLYSVGQTGGHFGAGLGVVELTIALHYVFDTPEDRLVWDVGHQAYPHKILTGRRERMLTMRQAGGLAAFPAEVKVDSTPSESVTPVPQSARPWACWSPVACKIGSSTTLRSSVTAR